MVYLIKVISIIPVVTPTSLKLNLVTDKKIELHWDGKGLKNNSDSVMKYPLLNLFNLALTYSQ